MLNEKPFYEFVREERLFCATLAHLLMQRGPNLLAFLKLVNDKLPRDSQIETTRLEEAQIYVEFTFLRDYWNTLKTNDDKRSLIFSLLARVDTLKGFGSDTFPRSMPNFNAYFMGERGKRILRDIVYPGQWSVETLFSRFKSKPEVFQDFCRFKWSFNIKPDLVIVTPGTKPLCIEAKLESKEGQYPASNRERRQFDEAFGKEKGRVNQVDLQQFMFECLLRTPCQLLVVGQVPLKGLPFLRWSELFDNLDLSSSIDYVSRLVTENRHVRTPVAASRLPGVQYNPPPKVVRDTWTGFSEERDRVQREQDEDS